MKLKVFDKYVKFMSLNPLTLGMIWKFIHFCKR